MNFLPTLAWETPLFIARYGIVIVWIISVYYRSLRSRTFFEKVNWYEIIKIVVNMLLYVIVFMCLLFQNLDLVGFVAFGKMFMVAVLMHNNIMFMMTLAKRYFTKKSIKNKYCVKRSYAMNGESNDEQVSSIFSNHKKLCVDFSETKINESEFLEKFSDNTFILLFTNQDSFDYKATEKTVALEKKLDSDLASQQIDTMLINTKELVLAKTSMSLSVSALVILIMNYTTKRNKQTQVLQPGAIKTGYLNKGISIHDKSVLVAIVKNDIDFNRVINLFEKDIKPDMEQTNLIKEYSSEGLSVEQITAEQAKKFVSALPIKYCKFDARSETKDEFIVRFKQAWIKIKNEQ